MNLKKSEDKLTNIYFDKNKNVVVIEGEPVQGGIVRFEITPSSLHSLFREVIQQEEKSPKQNDKSPIALVNEIFQKMSELKVDLVQVSLFDTNTKIDYAINGKIIWGETYGVSTGKNIASRLKILAGFPLVDDEIILSGEINTLEHGVKIKYFAKTKNDECPFFNIRPRVEATLTPKSLGQVAEETFIRNIGEQKYTENYQRGHKAGASAGLLGLPYEEPNSGDVGYNEGWEDGYLREGAEFRRRVYGEEASE